MTMSEVIEALIAKIKENPIFWDDDINKRTESTYTGFGSIRNNKVSQDFNQFSFPVLFIAPEDTKTTKLGRGIAPNSFIVTMQVSGLHVESDEEIAKIREKIEELLVAVVNSEGLVSAEDDITFFEDILKTFKTHNVAMKVEL